MSDRDCLLPRFAAAAGSLEELRLAANCDFWTESDVTEPSGSGDRRPANDQEVVPESEEEDECEWRHQPRGSQRSNESSKKLDVGIGETGSLGPGASKQPYREGGHRKDGAIERGKGHGFDALLKAVRFAESLKLLDLSGNGLEEEQCRQLKVVFETCGSRLDDSWIHGILKRL